MNWKIKGAIFGLVWYVLTYGLIYFLNFWLPPFAFLISEARTVHPILHFIAIVCSWFLLGWLIDLIKNEEQSTLKSICFQISMIALIAVLIILAYNLVYYSNLFALIFPYGLVWTSLALILPNLIGWLYAKFVGDRPTEDVTKGFFAGLITGIVFAVSLLVYIIYFTIQMAYVYGFGTEGNIQYGISSQLLYWVFTSDNAGLLLIAALVVPVAIASLIGWIVGKTRE